MGHRRAVHWRGGAPRGLLLKKIFPEDFGRTGLGINASAAVGLPSAECSRRGSNVFAGVCRRFEFEGENPGLNVVQWKFTWDGRPGMATSVFTSGHMALR